ncbi:MAG: hypothetical protein U5K30_16275 [Acidimicrobiales bacterium]|nr:hypothetical protein [Acidimicrobiales bacterium]
MTTTERCAVRLLAVLGLVGLVSACGGESDELGFALGDVGTVAWNLDDHVLPRSDVTLDGSSTRRTDGTEITQRQRRREVVRSR